MMYGKQVKVIDVDVTQHQARVGQTGKVILENAKAVLVKLETGVNLWFTKDQIELV